MSYIVTDLGASGREVFSKTDFEERNEEYKYQECLPCSTYKFEILDSYGDGLYYSGGFALKIDGEVALARWARPNSNVEFSSLSVTFSGNSPDCTSAPTTSPTTNPTSLSILPPNDISSVPSVAPTHRPSSVPSVAPTSRPSSVPSAAPSSIPSVVPTPHPTISISHKPSTGAQNCRDNDSKVDVDILTDKYPQDIQMTVYTDVANVTLRETLFTAPQPFLPETLQTFSFCIPCGSYELHIKDSYGDGIYAPGGYNITVDGNLVEGGKVSHRGVETKFSADKCKTSAPTKSPAPSGAPTTEENGACSNKGGIAFKFVLETDRWAKETSVEVVDTINGKSAFKVTAFEKSTVHEIERCLPCGNYTVSVLDSDGDGIYSDGLKLYLNGKLKATKKVEGAKTSVDFYKECPNKDSDVYLLFSQDFRAPNKLNAAQVAAFESGMATFVQKTVKES